MKKASVFVLFFALSHFAGHGTEPKSQTGNRFVLSVTTKADIKKTFDSLQSVYSVR